ncbi:hypothetical protein OCGS_0628 [Oceaniovalibus guishaninsula JLT2003]|uniref:Lipoprotein n=1 Tax=Oceaniovalibus guishaninsula JLT2003 TaxID=1231392 RepID=K2HDJ2_9RHOB|nr:hypothetical protein [Oceaniovalibus guishaninsula]EKE45538.1 hypothetical protein OCGS_0628 [Oceaniovalibus guishaninsula JLT2003]
MTMPKTLAILLAALMASPPVPAAACATAATGAGCATPLSSGKAGKWLRVPPRPTAFAVGDTLPTDRHMTVTGTEYLGLPPARDGWLYYRVGREIYRVDRRTGTVLEVMRR